MGRPRKYFTEEERLKAEAARRRKKRSEMTQEEREEHRRKEGKWKQNHFESMTPEQREKYLERHRKSQQKYMKKLTEEKAEQRRAKGRINDYMRIQAKLASMSKEEREEYDRKNRDAWRKVWREKTEDQKKARSQKEYFRKQAKLAAMTKEERDEWTKRNRERAKKWRDSLTGEKRKRYLQNLLNCQKKHQFGAYAPKSSKQYEKILEYQRQRTAMETPEERQKRLRRYKVNQAVRKLKKKLEYEGVPQEEIEEKVMELKERMWAEPLPPPVEISTYSRRPRKSNQWENEKEEGTAFVFAERPKRKLSDQKTTSTISGTEEEETQDDICVNSVVMEPLNLEDSLTSESELNVSSDYFEADDYGDIDIDDQYEDATITSASEIRDKNCHGDILEQYKETFITSDPLSSVSSSPPVAPVRIKNETPRTSIPSSEHSLSPMPSPVYFETHASFDDTISIPTRTKSIIAQSSDHSQVMKCPHCEALFSRRSDLTSHISCEHPKKCWTCPMCYQVVLTSTELKEHFKTEHTYKIPPKTTSTPPEYSDNCTSFNCIKCDILSPHSENVFGSLKDLNEHVKSKHLESYWPCSKCSLLKYSERSLKVHERVCRNSRRVKVIKD